MPPMGNDGWNEPWQEENDDSTSTFSFFLNIFTREAVPEDWNEEFMGPFDAERAAMMGFEIKREPRLGMITGAIVLLVSAIVIPIIIFNKRSKKLDFDDED
jgi:hypothetical protein